jgi:hypothetical protein
VTISLSSAILTIALGHLSGSSSQAVHLEAFALAVAWWPARKMLVSVGVKIAQSKIAVALGADGDGAP